MRCGVSRLVNVKKKWLRLKGLRNFDYGKTGFIVEFIFNEVSTVPSRSDVHEQQSMES
jgi:hypothetical protein